MISKFPFGKLAHAYVREGYLKNGGATTFAVYAIHISVAPGNWSEYKLSYARMKELSDLGNSTIRKACYWLIENNVIESENRINSKTGQKANGWKLLPPVMWGTGGVFSEEQGGCSEENMGDVPEITPLPYVSTTSKTTTNKPSLKKETIIREYDIHNLEDAVVAILKKLKVDQSFWPSLNDMPLNRVQALAELANKKAKSNAGGWFRSAVEGGWDIPGHDKKAFEIQCDLIRKNWSHLKSKATGDSYEILKYKTGGQRVIMTDKRGEVTLDEEGLEAFTYEAA